MRFAPYFSDALVPFERFAFCSSNTLVLRELFALFFSNILIPFEKLAPCLTNTVPGGLPFGSPCFSNILVPFERFASCFSNTESPFRAVGSLWQILQVSFIVHQIFNPFRVLQTACSLLLKHFCLLRALHVSQILQSLL